MKRLLKGMLFACLGYACVGALYAQCFEYRTNSYNYTSWYSSKQEACTASAEAT